MHVLFFLLLASAWQQVIADSSSCKSSTTISSQSDADSLADCDSLEGSITFSSSASGSIVFNNITEIKGSFTAQGASSVTEISAPDVTGISSALTIDNMSSLTKLSMASLSKVESGITITNNKNLKSLEFQNLEEVDGQLDLTGYFTSVLLPSLDQVDGSTTIKGKSPMSCTTLNALRSSDVFRGSYSCSVDGGGSSLSAGAKAGIAVGVIAVVILLLLAVLYVLRQRRQRQPRRRRTFQTDSPIPQTALGSEKLLEPENKSSPVKEQEMLVPRKPIGPPPALLDGRSIYEAAYPASPIPVYHELDAGPVSGSHQRPIHSEA
ncbi:hypothetical protein N7478_007096 [Penicillium angulare]|uniref:uncharacterized protein n=1 Tax=Penicillium angulare TaxID=116970 RepID=UPI0025412B09|nr:uncharacterized protein N7478_007096 [Penicillium angulare]KAJ5281724.1 hypothetical protein N7478_007096 [Penicillium angulare]